MEISYSSTMLIWLAIVNLDLNGILPNSGKANVCQPLQNIYGNLPTNQSKRGLYFFNIFVFKDSNPLCILQAQTDNTLFAQREEWEDNFYFQSLVVGGIQNCEPKTLMNV